MNTLYLDCTSGISGDMTVAALIDLGADSKALIDGLKSLNVDGFDIKINKKTKNNIIISDYDVLIEDEESITDFRVKRNFYDICNIIDNSLISDKAKQISKKNFKIKAESGSIVHNLPIEEFYFHESGALDSLADIIGAAICIDNLKINNVMVSEIHDGHGFINCRKGKLPVPVPAVSHIADNYGLDIISTEIRGEMVTPTGAAIVAGIKNCNKLPKDYKVKKIGFGNGKKKYNSDGFLRAYLIN